MAESNDLNNIKKRPLTAVHSCAGRLQDEGQESNEKVKSLINLNHGDSFLIPNTFEMRRRSQSAPLTLEATLVAKELKRLSDSLSDQYESKKRTGRNRRYTFGSPKDKELDRRSFHFDYSNYKVEEIIPTIDESPEFQRGTSV